MAMLRLSAALLCAALLGAGGALAQDAATGGGSAPQSAAPGDAAPGATAPGETAPSESAPGETAQGEAGPTQAPAGVLSPRAFTEAYAEALKRASPAVSAEIAGDLEVRLTGPDGQKATAYLDNAYRAYQGAPEDLEATLSPYVAAAATFAKPLPPLSPEDRARIVPVIKDWGWLRGILAGGSDPTPAAPAHEPLNALLAIVYAVDHPEGIVFLTEAGRETVGVAPDALRDVAIDNLRGLLKDVRIKQHGAIYTLRAGGDYDASLLLLDELWAAEGPIAVAGEIVVAIPSRDVVMATGSESLEAVAQMRAIAAEVAAQSPYRITAELFVRREGRFEVYRP